MVYAVMEGNRIWRMSKDREELKEYIKSFDLEERRKLFIVLLDQDKEEIKNV
jgi:hypothetical protein